MADEPTIDWSVFNDLSEQTCYCRCGTTFRSHTKAIYGGEHQGIHSRKPCPGCGRTDMVGRASTDPEGYDIRG